MKWREPNYVWPQYMVSYWGKLSVKFLKPMTVTMKNYVWSLLIGTDVWLKCLVHIVIYYQK